MSESEALIELSSEGYCKASGGLSHYLHDHPELRSSVFRFSNGLRSEGGGLVRYSTIDIFGERLVFYVLDSEEAKKDFSEYLTKIFLNKNPVPTSGMKNVFTRLIHQYDMHWEGCSHKSQINGIYRKSPGFKENR